MQMHGRKEERAGNVGGDKKKIQKNLERGTRTYDLPLV